MSNAKVFISYSHDSLEHSERVLDLAFSLRGNGIDVELDQFHNEEIVDWPRWCNERISREHSDFVLCVCTAEFKRRIEGNVPPEKGKGVYWEGSLLDDDIYDDKGNRRIIPVLFDSESESSIPRFLRGWTHCRTVKFVLDDEGYEHLLRILTGQAKAEKNELGTVPVLPTRRAPVNSKAIVDLKADISRIVKYAPAELIGREAETALLNDAWGKVQSQEAKRPHILTIVALGGEGKTSLVAKWVADLASQNWPGCEGAFAWSFYSQGTRDQMAASSDLFLKEALNFFGDDEDKQFAASNAGAFEKGQRLARIVGQRRALLILDGLEPLQYAPTSPTPGELKDQGIAALLKGLAANSHGLCVVTTRYALPDLRAFIGNTVHEEKLTRLSTDAGVALLQALGVKGSLRKTIPSASGRAIGNPVWNEYEKLVEDVRGHALTLNLLATYLRDAHAGDIRKRDLIKLEEADAEEQSGHAFHVMDAYVLSFQSGGATAEDQAKGQRALALLQLLGLFDRPATADCLKALWQGEAIAGLTEPPIGLSEAQRNLSLKRLEDAKLLTVNRAAGSGELIALDAHPLLREYFGRRVRQQQPGAWRAAHRRLYEHLCATTNEGDEPTLEDLQPLYQAVAHGCLCGLHNDAFWTLYYDRIQRRKYYATNILGAVGSDLSALAAFYRTVWSDPDPALNHGGRSLLLRQTSFSLRSLGRFGEAETTAKVAFENATMYRDRRGGNIIAAGLVSELALLIGKISDAIEFGELAVELSECAKDFERKVASRCTLATALHQAGKAKEALRFYRSAESIEAIALPNYPLLRSYQGFIYHELLQSDLERNAWRTLIGCVAENAGFDSMIDELQERAICTLTFAMERQVGILSIEINRLTLERISIYRAILREKAVLGPEQLILISRHTSAVVAGLRQAGQQQFVIAGLLTRAWNRFLAGQRTGSESAQSDLDEAWEIAERSSMRLFLADIHLYRARLFGLPIADFGLRNEEAEGGAHNEAAEPYPWESPQADLEAAEKLINDCGYHRRDEELADAKRAILGE